MSLIIFFCRDGFARKESQTAICELYKQIHPPNIFNEDVI